MIRYQVLFLGHSLGGGIAALAACLMNWDCELSCTLQGTTVAAATFAAPPVLVCPYVRCQVIFWLSADVIV